LGVRLSPQRIFRGHSSPLKPFRNLDPSPWKRISTALVRAAGARQVLNGRRGRKPQKQPPRWKTIAALRLCGRCCRGRSWLFVLVTPFRQLRLFAARRYLPVAKPVKLRPSFRSGLVTASSRRALSVVSDGSRKVVPHLAHHLPRGFVARKYVSVAFALGSALFCCGEDLSLGARERHARPRGT